MTLCSRRPSADSILEMCDSEKSLFFNSSEATTSSTNTTNDYDLNDSSSSSYKWAADARLQNKQEWEQIERIFYAEEPLPEDTKTKQEFKVPINHCIETVNFIFYLF